MASKGSGFIVFERKITFPVIRQLGTNASADSKAQHAVNPQNKYFSFGWDGPNVLAAYADNMALTNEMDMANAMGSK